MARRSSGSKWVDPHSAPGVSEREKNTRDDLDLACKDLSRAEFDRNIIYQ